MSQTTNIARRLTIIIGSTCTCQLSDFVLIDHNFRTILLSSENQYCIERYCFDFLAFEMAEVIKEHGRPFSDISMVLKATQQPPAKAYKRLRLTSY